jgi:hypothetical protein
MNQKDEMALNRSQLMQQLHKQAPPASLLSRQAPEEEPPEVPDQQPCLQQEDAAGFSMGDTIPLEGIRKAMAAATVTNAVRLEEEDDLQATMSFEPINPELLS